MEKSSVIHFVRERLDQLGLAQLPLGAVHLLAEKLAHQIRLQAVRSITPRAVARAILSSASSVQKSTQLSQKELGKHKP